MPNPASPDESDDAALWRRLLRGEEEAFTLVYRRHARALHRFARRMTGSAAVADDVVQDVFLAAIDAAARPQRGGGFDPERGSLRAYLYGAARNATLRRLRQPPPARDGAAEGAGQRRDEEAHALRSALAALEPSFREVVLLCDLEGLSYEEAAAAVDVPIGTVRSRLARARARLAGMLSDAPPAPVHERKEAR